jgi:hypothetical protein
MPPASLSPLMLVSCRMSCGWISIHLSGRVDVAWSCWDVGPRGLNASCELACPCPCDCDIVLDDDSDSDVIWVSKWLTKILVTAGGSGLALEPAPQLFSCVPHEQIKISQVRYLNKSPLVGRDWRRCRASHSSWLLCRPRAGWLVDTVWSRGGPGPPELLSQVLAALGQRGALT